MKKLFLFLLCVATVAPACQNPRQRGTGPVITRAMCRLYPTEGSQAQGFVEFVQQGRMVRIRAEMTGLPDGPHGFHIHEWGDCNCADGKCTGGHFNPAGVPHAGPDAKVRHVGDLGNIVAGPDGKAVYDRVDAVVEINGPRSIIGRAITVHADADDLTSQPTGAAGARIAVGVIGIGPPK